MWTSLSRLETLSTGEVSFPRTAGHLATHTEILVKYRGDDTIKLFSYMDKLRDQALAAGGMVLSHLGNHEWMNVIGMSSDTLSPRGPTENPSSSGDWRYVDPPQPFRAVVNIYQDMCIRRSSKRSVQSPRGER